MEYRLNTGNISLTKELVSNYTNLYFYLVFERELLLTTNIVRMDHKFTRVEVTLINEGAAELDARRKTGADLKTSLAHWKEMPRVLETNDFIVDMPYTTWDKLFTALQQVSVPKRKTYARVFCYLYYWAMRFNGVFTHSLRQIMNEIHIQNNLLTEAAEWLEDNNLLHRSGYLVINANRQARGYSFDRELWSDAAKNNNFYHK